MITAALLACSLALRAFDDGAVDQQASADEARALAAATDAPLARGDYQTAIRQAQSAFDLHERLGAHADDNSTCRHHVQPLAVRRHRKSGGAVPDRNRLGDSIRTVSITEIEPDPPLVT